MRVMPYVLGMLSLLLAATALATPHTLVHHGALSFNGAPIDGDVSVIFRLHDSSSDTGYLWEESSQVRCVAGYYSQVLGLSTLLDTALVAGAPELYLGLTVNGEELSPRLRVHSVPYAMVAGEAERAADVDCVGCVAASEVSFSFASADFAGGPANELDCDACIETAELANASVSLAKLTPCGENQLLRATASGWECSSAISVDSAGDVTIAGATQLQGGLVPDFDSGWVSETNSTNHVRNLTHSLGVVPTRVVVWFRPDESSAWWYPVEYFQHHNVWTGPSMRANTTTIELRFYTGGYVASWYNPVAGAWNYWTSGQLRVYAWR